MKKELAMINNINYVSSQVNELNNTSTQVRNTSTNKTSAFREQLQNEIKKTKAGTSSPATNQPDLNHLINAGSAASLSLYTNTSIKAADWLPLKPSDYSMEKFIEKIAHANYQQSLLDPDVLPRWVTKPEPNISRSTDMSAPPTFEETVGGVMRIDHTVSGKVKNFIPCYQWRKTSSGDGALGSVYNQQTPWGFRTMFIRDDSARTPEGYSENGYQQEINIYLESNYKESRQNASSSPPAELNWQQRLQFYNNPAATLLANLLLNSDKA